jgi:radical SAM superfamily enzyme YgiQ (UPF0313 family)
VFPTYHWREILSEEPHVTAIVRGEGEETVRRLIATLADGQRVLFHRDAGLRHAMRWYTQMGRRVWPHEILGFLRDPLLRDGRRWPIFGARRRITKRNPWRQRDPNAAQACATRLSGTGGFAGGAGIIYCYVQDSPRECR